MRNHVPVALKIVHQLDMSFVLIPAGSFLMGESDDGEWAFAAMNYEKPQSRIHLDEYWMGKHEVTNAQFLEFLRSSNYELRDHYTDSKFDRERLINDILSYGSDHPVCNISWYDAVGFCNWASDLTGLYIRLPSEAEWEKAARGADGLVFPWGNFDPGRNIISYANINWDDNSDTSPVGKYSPTGDSPYGCSDMIGNVNEWTTSLFSRYPYDPFDGREDTKEFEKSTYQGILPDHRQDKRVIRGGAYNMVGTVKMRCSWRGWQHSGYRTYNLGFRVVCMGL